jgi:hypothetical protein
MQSSMRVIATVMLATGTLWATAPALGASVHTGTAAPGARSSASRLSAKANANANNAAGNPYVNPNVGAGSQASQTNASANADAAEMRSAHVSTGTP